MPGYVVLDVETTGLIAWQHAIWEIGMCFVDEHGKDEYEHGFQIRLSDNDLAMADQKALDVGRFHERYYAPTATTVYDDRIPAVAPYDAARSIALQLKGRQVVAQPALFDLSFVKHFLWRHTVAETWSHRAVHDLKTWACAYESTREVFAMQGGHIPVHELSTDDLAELAGVEIPEGRHSALVDARMTRDIARKLGVFPS